MSRPSLLGTLLVVLSGLLCTAACETAKLLSARIDAVQITLLRCVLLAVRGTAGR